MPSVRFDDLRPRRRRSFALGRIERVLEAKEVGEVVDVLAEVEREVARGRWVAGFVCYEAAPAFDPVMKVSGAESQLPLAWFAVSATRRPAGPLRGGPYTLEPWESRLSREEYHKAVDEIRNRIRAGDTYQVNFTYRLDAPFAGSAEAFYRDLVNAQACGYGALVDTGRWVVASASPELFFEWRHGRIVSKPMKGTRRRGLMLAADERERALLESSEKDRAENLMIVDMVRNDLGRISKVGTVKVPALFTTEKYDTVWQLTSTVEAEPTAGTSLNDVFEALFPCASITGAPKVSTMAIIERLERDRRGVYCGAVGFGGPGAGGEPEWAFNVAIRTVVIDRAGSSATYGTGGGITYDSTTAGEYNEALLKAEVLARRSASFDLIETIRWSAEGGFWLLDRHLDRLVDSARYFDIPLDPAEIRAALRAAVAGRSGPLRVRLAVTRAGTISVETGPVPVTATVVAAVDSMPVDPCNVFLYHKTSNRTTYDEAAARSANVDDVILVNPSGEVTETTIGNLAVEIDGVWSTPPIAAGLLPGTYRAELISVGRLSERSITVSELKNASRLARVNALRGWEPLELG
ncbi:MAG TPA: aminodeoxychorismate synthase component I [Acidimicrobiia bacterium]|nr:aminodeoxychorismate synthase component I [Acidimicrobiia bacterium]